MHWWFFCIGFSGEIQGLKIKLRGVTGDDVGHVYLADEVNKQLFIFDSSDGDLLQEIKVDVMGYILGNWPNDYTPWFWQNDHFI